jgi:hypothetical protein
MGNALGRAVCRVLARAPRIYLATLAGTAADLFSFLRQLGYSHFYGISSRVTPLTEDYFTGGAILCSWEEVRGLA